MSGVTADLPHIKQWKFSEGSSEPVGGFKSQALAAAARKKPFDKSSVVCYYCDNKGHMQHDCYKRKADEAKGKSTPGGGSRECGHRGGPHARAALAATAFAGQPGSSKIHGIKIGSSTSVLESGSMNHIATWDKGLTVQEAGSCANVALANGDKFPIEGHRAVSMLVGKGNTKARMVSSIAMLVPHPPRNLLLAREMKL